MSIHAVDIMFALVAMAICSTASNLLICGLYWPLASLVPVAISCHKTAMLDLCTCCDCKFYTEVHGDPDNPV